LYFTICKLFPFYLQELSQYTTFRGFVQLFNRDTPVHFLTIISLSVFILILSLYLIVKNKFYKLPAAGNRFSPTSGNLSLTFLNRIITLRWLNWLYLIFPPFSFFLFLIGMLFLVLGTTSYSVWLLLLIVLLLLWQKRSWLQADNNEIYKLMEKLRNSNLAKWFMLISQNNKIRDQINKILLKKIAKGNLTEHVEMKRAFKNSFGDLFLNTLIMSLAIIVSVLFYNDAGYLINIWLFVLLLLLVLYYRRELNAFDGENINIKYKKYYTPFLAISGGSAVLLFYLIIVLTTYNFEPLGSGRFSGRVVSFFDYNKMQEIGLRESEKQSQFFAELGKYTYPSAYNTYEPVHSGISSFLDPVVKNDLSVPFGFIYQFQEWWWLAVFLLLFTWLSLIYLVVYSIVSIDNGSNMVFPRFALVRLFSVSVIAGSGFYLLCSYYNILPFTGRLIYGMGQDSIAEVYETIFLFAILGFIAPVQHNIKKNDDAVTT
jgi:hypothetical protein